MVLSRREVIQALGVAATVGYLPSISAGLSPSRLKKSGAVRLPLEEFAESNQLMKGLRRAVKAMKARKESDRRSWFFQAAIHGVSNTLLDDASERDPAVNRVFQRRYWNQCPHFGNNSANFLPWHRAYTYHFESIVRFHSDLEEFALPYWNYNDLSKPENRKFPREFGILHLDGDTSNNADENLNPLYLEERSFYFAGYEHPFTDQLPLIALTEGAVDASRALASNVFFGDTESTGLGGGIADENPGTRGLLEASPHDQIHRAVGGVIGATTGDATVGFMANPPTAAFDPIFPIHHTNIDRLWAQWSCMPGKQWGNLPSEYWFNERPWFFIDENGDTVNRPRKDYFDYRALGVRFADEDESCTPLALPTTFAPSDDAFRVTSINVIASVNKKFAVAPRGLSVNDLPGAATDSLNKVSPQINMSRKGARSERRVILRLSNVKLGLTEGTGFDVFVTRDPTETMERTNPGFVGSINLFAHNHSSNEHRAPAFQRGHVESFDVSQAMTDLDNFEDLKVVIKPFSLFEFPGQNITMVERDMLTIGSIEFLTVDVE